MNYSAGRRGQNDDRLRKKVKKLENHTRTRTHAHRKSQLNVVVSDQFLQFRDFNQFPFPMDTMSASLFLVANVLNVIIFTARQFLPSSFLPSLSSHPSSFYVWKKKNRFHLNHSFNSLLSLSFV